LTSFVLTFQIFNQAIYTSLPHLKVTILNETSVLKVPEVVDCTKGGQSTPIIINNDVKPFSDLKLSIYELDE